MKAQDFSLLDQFGKIHTLSQYKGKWVIVYFYPKDDTPGCTKEACGFRDVFTDHNVVILGISKDTVSSHKKFAEKYYLNFPILSDPEGSIINAYGAWGKKNIFGRVYMGILRKSYLINPLGEIAKVYEKVNPLFHAKEIMSAIMSQ